MNIFVRFGLLYACGITMLFNALWLVAYFEPSRQIVFDVNQMGEADLELILLMCVLTPLTIYATMRVFRDASNNVVDTEPVPS